MGAVELTIKKEKGKGRRIGAPNYSEGDVSDLLDVVAHVETFGNKEWAVVATKFEEYTHKHGRSARDAESSTSNLKNWKIRI